MVREVRVKAWRIKREARKGKTLRYWAVLIGAIVVVPTLAIGQPGRRQVREGNRLFAQEKYDEANNRYRDALTQNPESPIVHFNIGDALYKKRHYEEAIQAYQKAMNAADDVLLQSKAYYNIGNSLYKLGRLPESILAYKKALELNPNDEEAKYNLEYVRAKLKQESQKQPLQSQPQTSQSPDQQNQPGENKDHQKPNQDKQEQQQQEQKQQPAEGGRRGEISKEDAERILDALKNDEKDVQKERMIPKGGRRVVEKDW